MQHYQEIIQTLPELIRNNEFDITILSNTSALLFEKLPDINWAGFYLFKKNFLFLGPFQGKPACTKIPLGKGVCGTCAKNLDLLNISDVHQFPGHIACDTASKSEICIPIILYGKLYALLDIDAPVIHRFSSTDEIFLKQIVSILQKELEKIIDL